jgi:hypothetical protein
MKLDFLTFGLRSCQIAWFAGMSAVLPVFCGQAVAQTTNTSSPKTIAVSVPLDSNWSSSNGQEFPGAVVKVSVDANGGTKAGDPALTLTGDFTGGGAYCCAGRSLGDLQFDNVNEITMSEKTSNVSALSVRVVDETGQTLQAKNLPVISDGSWHEFSINPASLAGSEHWGGANDGKWHAPLTQFYLLIGPSSGPTKTPTITIANVDLITETAPMPELVRAVSITPVAGASLDETAAKPDINFLDSIGADSAIDSRGETLANTIKCAEYTGIHWFRAGIEGDMQVQTFVTAHKQAGLQFDWCIGSAGSNVDKLISTAHQIEVLSPGTILSFEGPNEPNNWGITYQGQSGGKDGTWLPVAKLQNAIYTSVKSDPILKNIPVWGISENGAEVDNVGLQYLTIPTGAGCLMPDGTKFADYANVHNYIYHQNSPNVEDNKTWNASDPTSACKVDGLYGEYGVTWAHHYNGYSGQALIDLPRVTTETGTTIGGDITENIHGLNLLSMYLDQFKRGWSYTAVYLLRDRVDEAGNQQFGFYRPNYTPRRAAVFLHNLTTILADDGAPSAAGKVRYTVVQEPPTIHDMLLQKKNGTYELLIWDEKVSGSDTVNVDLGRSARSVKVYDPTTGTAPVATLSDVNAVELTLTDHPAIIELPASAGV